MASPATPSLGNEELLAWVLTPHGVVWVLLAGGLVLIGEIILYPGLGRGRI